MSTFSDDLFDTAPAGHMMNSLLIEASAGSGKTYQLANRFLALVAAGVGHPDGRRFALPNCLCR